ncbi:YlmC/YmxH family sporulation protein [Ornithinibacillus gellani]|uniref:YlmC/YmxH family sporulation protein n=1 Tax=Ornithinibacillus gellani TaxID=2293253 RepID=UPI000F4A107D|nr:YlmC/YmxH family sporulation protein [Ornithinibacillus gellani]TQS75644.1 YlmC/YmxH family sporulation protein [Ornithinibacillus gellani]
MVRLSELQIKEVIVINDGRRLGHIIDLEIDPEQGRILAIILQMREAKGSFFGKAEELLIYWNQIVTIGADVILVEEPDGPQLYIQESNRY